MSKSAMAMARPQLPSSCRHAPLSVHCIHSLDIPACSCIAHWHAPAVLPNVPREVCIRRAGTVKEGELREQRCEALNVYRPCVALQGYTNYALNPQKGTYAQVPNQAPPFMGVDPAGNPTPKYTSYAAQAPASDEAADSAASNAPIWQQVTACQPVTKCQALPSEVDWP
jgi:hypothetical protein